MTVDVSVPTFNETLPLNSVHGWIVIQQRLDGSVDFNRSWAEFCDGFGDTGNGSFCLGNEQIYQLTNGGNCQGRFEVLTSKSRKWYSVEYG